MLHQLLHGVKLGPRGDVVATVVKFADLVMLDVVSLVVVPITDGQGVSAWERRERRGRSHIGMYEWLENARKAPQRQL